MDIWTISGTAAGTMTIAGGSLSLMMGMAYISGGSLSGAFTGTLSGPPPPGGSPWTVHSGAISGTATLPGGGVSQAGDGTISIAGGTTLTGITITGSGGTVTGSD